MPAMRRLSLAVSLVLLALVPSAASAATCTGNPSEVKRLDLSVGGQPTYGLYTMPAGTPRGMVVFGHGYSYNVDAWREHMIRAATKDGLVAVTMDYRGLKDLPKDSTGFERARGWPVKAGSEDLIAAGQYFDRLCGGFDRRFLLGVSMGGNSTGMAAALKAKTLDGRPLFDYWVGIEGVWNLTELAGQARAAAPTSPFTQQAYDDIVAENGGTPEEKPDESPSGPWSTAAPTSAPRACAASSSCTPSTTARPATTRPSRWRRRCATPACPSTSTRCRARPTATRRTPRSTATRRWPATPPTGRRPLRPDTRLCPAACGANSGGAPRNCRHAGRLRPFGGH